MLLLLAKYPLRVLSRFWKLIPGVSPLFWTWKYPHIYHYFSNNLPYPTHNSDALPTGPEKFFHFAFCPIFVRNYLASRRTMPISVAKQRIRAILDILLNIDSTSRQRAAVYTIPSSCPIFLNLWRHATFTRNSSTSRRMQSYQLFSTSALPQFSYSIGIQPHFTCHLLAPCWSPPHLQ